MKQLYIVDVLYIYTHIHILYTHSLRLYILYMYSMRSTQYVVSSDYYSVLIHISHMTSIYNKYTYCLYVYYTLLITNSYTPYCDDLLKVIIMTVSYKLYFYKYMYVELYHNL